MGVQDLRVNKMERKENKSNLNENATTMEMRVILKNIAIILLKNRNREGV